MKQFLTTLFFLPIIMFSSCTNNNVPTSFTGEENEVKLITLDPGHFHAALVQKQMYPQVNPKVYVYSPGGEDLEMHLNRIENFNHREENPTQWETYVYKGEDYLDEMLTQKNGNVVVIAGNNSMKANYIYQSVRAGLHVLSDKPMAINTESFTLLQEAFQVAEEKNVLLYDIMTERYDITSRLQREIAQIAQIFGELQTGTPENPAVVKESVHHFFKYVSGNVLQRPPWYFDVAQQGEGIVDVTTHLVDLVQWICFPDQIINYASDIDVYDAIRNPTQITREQFMKVTGMDHIPQYLGHSEDSLLYIYANGEINYSINNVHTRVSVLWNYAAPEGGGDTHFSVMKGSKSNLIIRQGSEQNFLPMLYIVPAEGQNTEQWNTEVAEAFIAITEMFPQITLTATSEGFVVDIPVEYRIGHEAHFAKVTEKYLQFLVDGKLPVWEKPNMLSKYYTTTKAWEIANGQSN